MWTVVRSFVRNHLRRNRVERDLSEEIDSYADLLIEEKEAGLAGDPCGSAYRSFRVT